MPPLSNKIISYCIFCDPIALAFLLPSVFWYVSAIKIHTKTITKRHIETIHFLWIIPTIKLGGVVKAHQCLGIPPCSVFGDHLGDQMEYQVLWTECAQVGNIQGKHLTALSLRPSYIKIAEDCYLGRWSIWFSRFPLLFI